MRFLDGGGPPSKKRMPTCIIHTGSENLEDDLIKPKDKESWQTLYNAAKIRDFKPVLDLVISEDEIPEIYYHRKCRSVFTLKKKPE